MLPKINLIKSKENDWLILDSPDHIGDYIKKNGYWGAKELIIAKTFLSNRSNVNVIDVGANIGGFTIPVAKLISKNNGKLIAFEPQRIVFQQLCANIFVNRLDNVYTHNIALADKPVDIKVPELNFWKSQNVGGLSLDPNIRKMLKEDSLKSSNFSNEETGEEYLTKQLTLDSFNFDFKINLIKVDIEGYELEFFIGASQTIKDSNFPPIIFELWEGKTWYDEKASETRKFLINLGYNFDKFGREILAQHPDHPFQCKITKENNKINLSLKR